MDKKQIRQRLWDSLEVQTLWARTVIIVIFFGILYVIMALRGSTEGLFRPWLVAAVICGIVTAPWLVFALIRTARIFRRPDQYVFCRTTLATPHGGPLRDTIYYTALVTDPDTGEKFFVDTHAIFFARGIVQPLMEDYTNATVTIAWNRETGMVVVIG